MSDDPTQAVPEAGRPHPLPEYGIPDSPEGLLSWGFVRERMIAAQNYWVCTTMPDGRPHARPVWGVWVDETLHFGGGAMTRWAKNAQRDPGVTVHLESGSEVVIFEGTVTAITEAKDPRVARIDAAYMAKYNMEHGVPIWILTPHKVFAWSEYPTTVTRWVFD